MQSLKMQRSATVGRAFTATRPAVRPVCLPQRSLPQAQRMSQPLRASSATAADLDDSTSEYPGMGSSRAVGTMALEEAESVKLRIRMRGYDVKLLQAAVDQVSMMADATGAVFRGPVMLPTKRKIFCVLRSPHVDKDAREHFEIRTHNRLLDVTNLSSETVQAMMNWVPPSGLEVECTIV